MANRPWPVDHGAQYHRGPDRSLRGVGLAPAFGTDRAACEVCTHRGAGALDCRTAALSRTSHHCASNDAAAAAQVRRRLAPGQRLFRDRDAAVLRRQSRLDRAHCAPVYPDQTLLDADLLVRTCLQLVHSLEGCSLRANPLLLGLALWPDAEEAHQA